VTKLQRKSWFEFVQKENQPLLSIACFNGIEGFDECATVRFRCGDFHGLDRWSRRPFSPASVVMSIRLATTSLVAASAP